MILTNKLNVKFNRAAIDEDFDIFRIEREENNYYNGNLLDIAGEDFKALSVVYEFGRNWYVLFEKDKLNYEKFKERIAIEDPEAKISRVLVNEEDCLYDNILFRLIINTLAVSQNKDHRYNNLTGRLYYTNGNSFSKFQKTQSFFVLEINVNWKMYVTLNVKTFSKYSEVYNKKKVKRFYTLDENTLTLRRMLKTDEESLNNSYIDRSINPYKKNTVDFLNFGSLEEFNNCKLGVYQSFLKDVKMKLNKYIEVSNNGFTTYNSYSDIDVNFENKKYCDLLRGHKLLLVDEINNEQSKALLTAVKEELKLYHGVETCNCKSIEADSIIRLINNKKYYENKDCESKDIYLEKLENVIYQHITLEDFKLSVGNKSSAATKILQELIIKSDIKKFRLSLVNWNIETQINFVNVENKYSEEKNKYYQFFTKMTINPDGSFKFDEYYNDSFSEVEEWRIISETYLDYNKSSTEVEGFIYTDYNDLNIIINEGLYTIPDIAKISSCLELSNEKKEVDVDDLIELLNLFKEDAAGKERTQYLEVLKKFESYPKDNISIKEVRKLLNIRTSFGKKFNDYYYQNRGLLIHPRLRAGETKEDCFKAVLDIKFFEGGDNSQYYFVGTADKKLNTSLHNACRVRKVVSLREKFDWEILLKMLQVEFVRNGQYTVLPFAFKYINEYNQMKKN